VLRTYKFKSYRRRGTGTALFALVYNLVRLVGCVRRATIRAGPIDQFHRRHCAGCGTPGLAKPCGTGLVRTVPARHEPRVRSAAEGVKRLMPSRATPGVSTDPQKLTA